MKRRLESLYDMYTRREYVHPDPLEFLYGYSDPVDREVVGFVASALAFGRVAQILGAVSTVIAMMGDSPGNYLAANSPDTFVNDTKGFVYRFVRGEHLASLFVSLKGILARYGSIGSCFVSHLSHNDETLIPAMSRFVGELLSHDPNPGYLVATPDKGSACKRMNLYLRWMVRHDSVDPGGWAGVDPSLLVVPLDTHMHTIGLRLGFTHRKQAGMRTALEITDGFRKLSPEDPVKYDFSLTRFGIRHDMSMEDLFRTDGEGIDTMPIPGMKPCPG